MARHHQIRRLSTLILSIGLLTAAGCTNGKQEPEKPKLPPAPAGTVMGTITYNSPLKLTDEAVVRIELRDDSTMYPDEELLAQKDIEHPGQVPIPFSISFDQSKFKPDHSYVLLVRISEGRRLIFSNGKKYYVLTHANPSNLNVVLEPQD